MRLRDLPGYPRLYLDFVEHAGTARTVLPPPPAREILPGRLREVTGKGARKTASELAGKVSAAFRNAAAQDSLRRLAQPGATAIVAEVHPAPYGGHLGQLLQLLTAIRLAAELEATGLPAVPIAWIGSPLGFGEEPAALDIDGRLVGISNLTVEQLSSNYPSKIKETDSYRIISDSFGTPAALRRATGALYSALLAEYGLLVIDPDEMDFVPESGIPADQETDGAVNAVLAQQGYFEGCGPEGTRSSVGGLGLLSASAVLPVGAFVVSAWNICATASALPLLAKAGVEPPVLWPGLTATLVDARSRKIMEKYGFELRALFGGTEALLADTEHGLDGSGTLETFVALQAGIDSRLKGLRDLVPEGDEAVTGMISEAQSKMQYQVQKVKERYQASLATRSEAAARQILRVSNSLAPRGRRQEEVLAAVHVILRYSRALMDEIMRKGDVGDFQHQLIFLD